MTPQELDAWIEYARLKGGVSPLSRIENALWQTGAMTVSSVINSTRQRSFVKAKDFMPEPIFNPMISDTGEADADQVAKLFGAANVKASADGTYTTSSGLKIVSGKGK